jgi:hypothetical protein
MEAPPADVPSPCVQVCQIDPGSGLCRGCLRSLDEIASWSNLGAREKRAVLARLPLRRDRLPALR